MINSPSTQSLPYFALLKLIIKRELTLAFRHKDDVLNPILFFIIVVTLFPLGIGPASNTLAEIAPGVIWVAALLATLLSLDRIFKSDFTDGTLEQLLISPQPTYLIVLGKVIGHWLITGLPLIFIAPILGVALHLNENAFEALMLTLFLGTPVLSFIGAIGAALTVRLKNGGVVLSLLVLPLFIPVLIFATSTINTAAMNLPYDGQLAIIAALFVGALTLAPFAISSALKVSTN